MSITLTGSVLIFGIAWSWAVWLGARRRDWRPLPLLAVLTLLPSVLTALPPGVPPDLAQLTASGTSALLAAGLGVACVAAWARAPSVPNRAQRQLRLERAYLEELFQNSPEGIVLLGEDDTVARANRAFTHIFGYGAEEVAGRRINDLIVPLHLRAEGKGLTTAVAEGRPVSVETVRQRKDGTLVDVSILGVPIRVGTERVAVYGIYRDITARRGAEMALRASEDKYRTVLDTIEEGYYEVDVAGNLVSFNRALAKIIGRTPDAMHGLNNRAYMDEEHAKSVYRAFNAVYRTGRPARSVEWQVVRGDGQRRHVEGSVTPIRTAEGAILGFRGMVRDVTERKDAEGVVRRQWAAIEASIDGMAITDEHGCFLYVNDAHARMHGHVRGAELVGRNWRVLYGPDQIEALERVALPTVRRVGTWRGEAQGSRADGQRFPQELSISALQEGGLAYVVRDITHERRAAEALRDSEARYAIAARGANDGLWDWNLRTGQVYYSPRWREQLGCSEQEILKIPDEWFRRVHPDDLEVLRADLDNHLAGYSLHFENEHRMLHADGEYRWMLSRGVAVRDAEGVATRIAGSQTDVTSRKRVEEQLQHDAFHDALTGLPNRALFMDRLEHALRRTKRRPEFTFAVLFLDLDRFKVINDSLGHALGDDLLVAMSQRLQTCIRPGDTVARLGGDEFVLLLEDVTHVDETITVAHRVHAELSRPAIVGGHEVFTTVSIGIAVSDLRYDNPDELLRDADLAMFRAKSSGRSRHEVFDATMHERAVRRLQLESDLRRVIERGELEVHYQPIVSLEDGRLTGFEALLRWEHPMRGSVPPDEFIPIAEDTGTILPIGIWVLEEACRQMRIWQEQYPEASDHSVHVNLSGRQFLQPDLVPQVSRILTRTGLRPRCLSLEITESVVMEDAESAARMLAQLRSLDVRLQIDDFGTGYSSLSYLHRFPIDTLKIDRSFVVKLGVNGESTGIVRSIISLARDLQMRVVAEGVETAAQAELLKGLGCDLAQGRHLSGVLRGDDVPRTLAAAWRAPV